MITQTKRKPAAKSKPPRETSSRQSPNSHGVFEKHFTNKVASHKKGHASVLLATDGTRWYAGYDFRCNECAGGGLPSTRESFATREEAAERSLKSLKIALDSHLTSSSSKTNTEVIRNLLKQIDTTESIHSLHTPSSGERGYKKPIASRIESSSRRITPAKEVIHVPLDKLYDHPSNPVPSASDVEEQVGWMQGGEQFESAIVRTHPTIEGAFEVLSGRRRLAAARKLEWPTLQCVVRDDFASEAEAVEFIFAINADRHADTPLRQAQGIAAMIEAGRTKTEAGAVYGLKTESAVTNKLRLLELPEVWQQRVISGEMPESAARMLVPYVEHPTLLEAFDADYVQLSKSKYPDDYLMWRNRDLVADQIRSIIQDNTRPVAAGDRYNKPRGDWGLTRKFPLTDEVRTQCEIVSLPIGENGKLVERALNVKAFDKLNDPLLKEGNTGKASGTQKKAKAAKKLSPAAQAAVDKERIATAKAKTAAAIEIWRHRMLRLQISGAIESGSHLVSLWLPYVMAHARRRRNEFGFDPVPLRDYLEASQTVVAAENARCGGWKNRGSIAAIGELIASDTHEDEISLGLDVQAMLLRFLIWPQCESRPKSLEHVLAVDPPPAWRNLPFKNRPPVVLLEIDSDDVTAMAMTLDVDVSGGWRGGTINGSRHRRMVMEFFELHTREQLDELAGELFGACSVTGTQISDQKRISEKVDLLMAEHTSASPLKLPASLAKASGTRRKK
jgi:ParB/RepB/Spo0J family partition protein